MTKWFLVLAFTAACGGGGKAKPADTEPEPVATPDQPPAAEAAAFASVAELTKATADNPQHLDGKAVELSAMYLNSKMQNVAGVVHYDVTVVDGKDTLTVGVTCRTSEAVTLEPFTAVIVHGTLRDNVVEDCTLEPR